MDKGAPDAAVDSNANNAGPNQQPGAAPRRFLIAFNKRQRLGRKLREHLSNLDKVEEALKVEPQNEELLKLKEDLGEVIRLVSNQILGKIPFKKPKDKELPSTSTTIGEADNLQQNDLNHQFGVSGLNIPVIVKDLTNPSSTSVKFVRLTDAAATIPNLPPYFYQTFEELNGSYPPGPDPVENNPDGEENNSSTSATAAGDGATNVTAENTGEKKDADGGGDAQQTDKDDGNLSKEERKKRWQLNRFRHQTEEQKNYAKRKLKFNNSRNAKIRRFLEALHRQIQKKLKVPEQEPKM